MDTFRLFPDELPQYLYRVQYLFCRTVEVCDDSNGLAARDTDTFYTEHELDTFRQSVEKHLDWYNCEEQPYVSCFSDRRHAVDWAAKTADRKGISCTLWKIDTSLMKDIYVFSIKDITSRLGINLPERASRHQNTYLCLHSIPMSAVVSIKEATRTGLTSPSKNLMSDMLPYPVGASRRLGKAIGSRQAALGVIMAKQLMDIGPVMNNMNSVNDKMLATVSALLHQCQLQATAVREASEELVSRSKLIGVLKTGSTNIHSGTSHVPGAPSQLDHTPLRSKIFRGAVPGGSELNRPKPRSPSRRQFRPKTKANTRSTNGDGNESTDTVRADNDADYTRTADNQAISVVYTAVTPTPITFRKKKPKVDSDALAGQPISVSTASHLASSGLGPPKTSMTSIHSIANQTMGEDNQQKLTGISSKPSLEAEQFKSSQTADAMSMVATKGNKLADQFARVEEYFNSGLLVNENPVGKDVFKGAKEAVASFTTALNSARSTLLCADGAGPPEQVTGAVHSQETPYKAEQSKRRELRYGSSTESNTTNRAKPTMVDIVDEMRRMSAR